MKKALLAFLLLGAVGCTKTTIFLISCNYEKPVHIKREKDA